MSAVEILDRFGRSVNSNEDTSPLVVPNTFAVSEQRTEEDAEVNSNQGYDANPENLATAAMLRGLASTIEGAVGNTVEIKLSATLEYLDGKVMKFRARPLKEVAARITHYGASQILKNIEESGEEAGVLAGDFARGLRNMIENIEEDFPSVRS